MAEQGGRVPDLDTTTIDFLILADRVEAINAKLYMMGGAWDRILVADFAQPVELSLAVGVLIPWAETNEDHQLTITLEDADGNTRNPPVQLNVNMGRPADAVRGQIFRAVAALNGRFVLAGPGTHRFVARLDNGHTKTVALYAHQAPQPPPQPPPLLG
jgi:hypothetical protein